MLYTYSREKKMLGILRQQRQLNRGTKLLLEIENFVTFAFRRTTDYTYSNHKYIGRITRGAMLILI